MVKTVQRCETCGLLDIGPMALADCQQERCPRSTVEAVVEIKEPEERIAKPRRQTIGRKLNLEQVIEIRKLAKRGWMNTQIARQFDVSPATVGQIVRGKAWADAA